MKKVLIKKAFTLVELLVVIAILAVLATVSIIGYSSFTKKAQISNDESVIAQMNIALQANEANGKPQTPSEVVEQLEGAGFIVKQLTPAANGYEYIYNMAANRFVYVDDKGGVVNGELAADAWDNWEFISEFPAEDRGYSFYLKDNFATTTFTISAGVDVGKNSNIQSITYSNVSGGHKSVVIRTNGGNLTVNGPQDHIEHFGLAENITVQSVSATTYVEVGTVASLVVEAGAQNVVIKETATVVEIQNSSSSLKIEGGFVGQVTGTAPTQGSELIGGDVIKVYTYEQLAGLAQSSTLGTADDFVNGKTISIQKDIDLTGKEWVPFGFSYEHSFYGTIDGNGHKIIGLTNKYTDTSKLGTFAATSSGISGEIFGFIGVACAKDNAELVVKNIHFVDVDIEGSNLKGCAAVCGVFGDKSSGAAANAKATFQNVTVSGNISGKDKIAGFIGGASHNDYIEGHVVLFEGCTNAANISAASGSARAAGFVGQFGDGKPDSDHTSTSTLTFNNCVNSGNIKSTETTKETWAGAFVAHWNLNPNPASSTKVVITVNANCTYSNGSVAVSSATGHASNNVRGY